MGDPDFDFVLPTGVRDRPRSVNTQSSTRNPLPATPLATAATRSLSRDYHGRTFHPLPGSKQEAQAVAKLLGGDCALRLGQHAREAGLKAVVSARVLHLGTDGF